MNAGDKAMTEEKNKLPTLIACAWLLPIGTSTTRPDLMATKLWLLATVAIAVNGSLLWLQPSLQRQRRVAARNHGDALDVE